MSDREQAENRLNRQFIYEKLPEPMQNKLSSLCVFESVTSTNGYVLKKGQWADNKFIACIANQQTEGRGRNGKEWVSPPDANIYLSLGKVFDATSMDKTHGLSLACGVAIARLLYSMGIIVGIKWPNDIWFKGKKLAGILVETRAKEDQLMVVVGVGLNINMPSQHDEKIDQPWVDLKYALEATEMSNTALILDRNLWAAELLNELMACLLQYDLTGFKSFESDWTRYDILTNRNVTINTGAEELNAKVLGINKDCSLKVEINHHEKSFYAADITLKI